MTLENSLVDDTGVNPILDTLDYAEAMDGVFTDKQAVELNIDEDVLIKKYNKWMYTSISANRSQTYLKIGPHEYGGEIQNIKIIEDKAINVLQGVRTNTDFLSDDGSGDADVQITMVFSGIDHIMKGLVPLIALFKVSPITSVKNTLIETVLYNRFTENAALAPDKLMFDRANAVLSQDLRKAEYAKIREVIGGTGPLTEAEYTIARGQGVESIQGKSYSEWLAGLDEIDYFVDNPTLTMDLSRKEADKAFDAARTFPTKIDQTGHVPVAMTSIRVSTNPDLLESLVVVLSLKRIGVGNFLRDFLQYRDIKNNPTPDPRRAFWLNRAIDIYIDRFMPHYIVNKGMFDSVRLKFVGDEVGLKLFSDTYNLKDMTLAEKPNPFNYPGTGTVVTGLSYMISNKFAFKRLQGESYPTAQFMGVSSGLMSMSLLTNDPEKLKEIHTYKSAADFFIRAADRSTRFNGWRIKSFLSLLFNTKENTEAATNFGRDNTNNDNKLYYPLNVITTTDQSSPGLRSISITFAETALDFFTQYGFVLYGNGMNLDILHRFYDSIAAQSTEAVDKYASFIMYGSGEEDEKYSIFNPQTMLAAFLEKETYEQTDDARYGASGFRNADFSLARDIARSFLEDPKISGQLKSANQGFELVLEQLWSINLIEFIGNDPLTVSSPKLDEVLATRMTDLAFVFNEPTLRDSLRPIIIDHLRSSVDPDKRKDLYGILHPRLVAGTISLSPRYLELLFSTIVNRRKVPITDRLYERESIAYAYDTLERAINVRGDQIDADANFALTKSQATDKAVIFTSKGGVDIRDQRISAYTDYLYVTYQELFDIPEILSTYQLPDYWKVFAYTYHDMGIINQSSDAYPDNNDEGLSDGSVQRAQFEYVTKPNSPIPPSVFFHRERELESLRDSLKKEYKDWHDRLKAYKIEIPYDVEYLVRESGKFTGQLKTDKNEDVDDINDPEEMTAATSIERMQKYIKNSKHFNDTTIADAGRLALTDQYRKVKETFGSTNPGQPGRFADVTDAELMTLLNNSSSLREEFYKQLYSKVNTLEVSVPLLYTTNFGKEVYEYKRVSGTRGAAIYKQAVQLAASVEGKTVDEFIGDTIVKPANGQDEGVGLTKTMYDEAHNMMLKITQTVPDNRNDMIKAFPVFKLYLIDYNGGDRIFVRDNFYGYNGIISIDVTQDKNDADLAVIRIADPLSLLQGSVNKEIPGLSKGVIDGVVLPTATDDTLANNFLSRFELKQGKAIQIRGGYSADPENLDILFTGRIAEVQFGDVVTVVAQGWKAELLGKQVEFDLRSIENSSVKDLVVRTIRDADPAGLGQTITYQELQQLKGIGGGLAIDGAIIRSIQNQKGTFGGQSGYSGTEGFNIFGTWNVLGNKLSGVDLRLKNIWTPDTDKSRANPFAGIETSGWEGRSWLIPMQPAWDVLQSATNYAWGYMCQVVPYDGEGTLFFGRPDQLYYYTKGNPKTNSKYRRALDRTERDANKDFEALFFDFKNSKWYSGITFPKDFEIFQQASDYLTQAFDIKVGGSIVRIDPNTEYGYSNYRELLNKTFESVAYGGGFGDQGVSSEEPVVLTDLVPKNYQKDFRGDLDYIAEKLGGEEKAAYLTFCSFFGFSTQYMAENFYPVYGTVRDYLGVLNEQSKAVIKRNLIDKIQSQGKYTESNEVLGLIPAEEVASYLSVLKDKQIRDYVSNNLKWRASSVDKTIYLDSGLSIFLDDQDEKVINLLNAMSVFLATEPSWSSIYPEVSSNAQTSYRISSASVDDRFTKMLKVGINLIGVSQDNVPSELNSLRDIANSDKSNNIIDATIDYFDRQSKDSVSEESAIRGSKVFDPMYLGMSRSLQTNFDTNGFNSKDKANEIVENLPLFRAYIHYLRTYLEFGSINVAQQLDSINKSGFGKFPPALNMKCFRDFHYISSGIDIVENNIAASTREMHNTVVIRHPLSVSTNNDSWWKLTALQGDYDSAVVEDLEWTSWPTQDETQHIGFQFNESISLANKKVYVYTDLNIRSREQAAKAATNVLPKLVRPMYRNNILIMGRAMKPWDQIYLDDKYIDMRGPIEVERVVHHYSVDQGWVTNVIPHAVCEANPGNSTLQVAIWNSKMDRIFNAVDTALWGVTILTAIPTAGASLGLGSTAGKAVLGKLFEKNLIPFVPKAMTKAAGEKFAIDYAAAGGVTAKFNMLKDTFVGNGVTTVKAFYATTAAQWVNGTISRGFMANAGAGDMRQAIVVAPLLFKGIPFEAGLNGQESGYWSLSSKLHWGYKDLIKGIENWGLYVQDIFGPPTHASTYSLYSGLKKGTSNDK